MEKSVSVAEAKAALSECIRQVEAGSSMIITRHGKPVAALVPPNDLEHLERLRKAVSYYAERHPPLFIEGFKEDLNPRYILIDILFFNKICDEAGLNPLEITAFEGYRLKKIHRLTNPTGRRVDFIMPLTKWR